MASYVVTPIDCDEVLLSLSKKIRLPDELQGLRQGGWRGFMYDTKNVIKFFDKFDLTHNTVGTANGNEYLPNVRRSSSIGSVRLEDNRNEVVNFNMVKDLYSDHTNYDDEELLEYHVNDQLSSIKFQLHRYGPGGVFAKHADGKKTPRHFATMLLFPPANLSPFEGGDLILYPENSDPVVIQPSKFTQWTWVVFKIDLPHECTLVTCGFRFVFKGELDLPEIDMFFSNTQSNATVVPVLSAENILAHENKIAQLTDKIIRHQAKIAKLQQQLPNSKVLNLMEQIENHNGNVCVVLATDAATIDPSMLRGQEAMLWNLVARRWPYSSLQVLDTSYRAGDNINRPSDTLSFEDDEECFVLRNAKILYWKAPVKPGTDKSRVFGKVKKTRSEYNDQTYDKYYDLTVTIICVQKNKYTE